MNILNNSYSCICSYSEDTYVVFDYCARNMTQMSLLDDNCANAYKYLLMLTILENHEGKTVEMVRILDFFFLVLI